MIDNIAKAIIVAFFLFVLIVFSVAVAQTIYSGICYWKWWSLLVIPFLTVSYIIARKLD